MGPGNISQDIVLPEIHEDRGTRQMKTNSSSWKIQVISNLGYYFTGKTFFFCLFTDRSQFCSSAGSQILLREQLSAEPLLWLPMVQALCWGSCSCTGDATWAAPRSPWMCGVSLAQVSLELENTGISACKDVQPADHDSLVLHGQVP